MSKAPTGSRGAGYGLDAELARKQAEKYDVRDEQMARNWIENVTNEKVEGDFGPALKNGRLLCNLMNTIKPGSIRKVETSNMPFKQMENISNFLKAARTVGIAEYELFETVDLYEEKVTSLSHSPPLFSSLSLPWIGSWSRCSLFAFPIQSCSTECSNLYWSLFRPNIYGSQ
jgi:hypothetical protein